MITEISRLSARERQLISHSRATETIMQPEPDKLGSLIDTTRALEGAGVRYALIGGVAVGIHACRHDRCGRGGSLGCGT